VNENTDLLLILNKHQEKYLLSFIIINILYLTRNKRPQIKERNGDQILFFFCHKVHSKFVLS
jgi:hypothetical protein